MDFLLLIVEDDAFLRIDLADALAAGLGVVPQMRGSLAEAMAYDGRMPDLAILDIDLGDGKVFPFADRLAAAGVPILFLSGSRRQDLPDRFQGQMYMSKPYDEPRLMGIVAARRAALGGAP